MNASPFYAPPTPISPEAAGYLPLNLRGNRSDRPHRLARIDPCFRDELLRFNWRTTVLGTVHRIFRDVLNSKAEGRTINHVEHLALRLLDLPPASEWHAQNGDILDLRMANLRVGPAPDGAVNCEPGASFCGEASYAAAIQDLSQQRRLYIELLRLGPTPKLTEAQVKRLLEAVREHPLLVGASLRTIAEYMDDEFHTIFYPSYLCRVLRGDALRVRDFDYESLKAVRRTRAQVAREHWQHRREEDAA